MSYYNKQPTDSEWEAMENFPCPFNFKCETCEYDCDLTEGVW